MPWAWRCPSCLLWRCRRGTGPAETQQGVPFPAGVPPWPPYSCVPSWVQCPLWNQRASGPGFGRSVHVGTFRTRSMGAPGRWSAAICSENEAPVSRTRLIHLLWGPQSLKVCWFPHHYPAFAGNDTVPISQSLCRQGWPAQCKHRCGQPCGKALSKRGCLHWDPSSSPLCLESGGDVGGGAAML